MGLFSGKNFSLKNVFTMPFDIVKNDLSFINEFRKDPKGAFGRKQKGMTKILSGVGLNEDSKLVKNSDAIMATVLGGFAAGGALGGGAAAGAQGGATAGIGAQSAAPAGANLVSAGGQGMAPVYESVGTSVGQSTATNSGQIAAQTGANSSGAWLKNPYAEQGMGLLQGQLNKPQQQIQPVQMKQSNLMAQAQQPQGTGYQYRGLLS